jgi:hypothetical protein
MIPFWHFEPGRRPTHEENLRAFRIVFYFALGVALLYGIVALSVFGHL